MINNAHTVIDIGEVIEDPDNHNTEVQNIPTVTEVRNIPTISTTRGNDGYNYQDIRYIDDTENDKWNRRSNRIDDNVDFGLDRTNNNNNTSTNIKYSRFFNDDENKPRSKRSSSLSRLTKDRNGGYELTDKFNTSSEKKTLKNSYEGTSVILNLPKPSTSSTQSSSEPRKKEPNPNRKRTIKSFKAERERNSGYVRHDDSKQMSLQERKQQRKEDEKKQREQKLEELNDSNINAILEKLGAT